MTKEKPIAARSDTSTKQNIETFLNFGTVSDNINNHEKKSVYPLKSNNWRKEKSIMSNKPLFERKASANIIQCSMLRNKD